MNLNLGCGRTRYPGYVGVDITAGGEADVLADGRALPFHDAVFDEVLASHVLEHFEGFGLDHAMREIARVLKPGGRLLARTPNGLRGLLNPHHFHAFKEETYSAWTTPVAPSLQVTRLFEVERSYVTSTRGFPQWHLAKYLPRLYRLAATRDVPPRFLLPIRYPNELTVILRRV